jgi:SulP family sulfate permease
MGVLQPRRRDSRASVLSRNLMFDREQGMALSPESLVEHANLASSPGPVGAEPSSYNGSRRTPSRSFYHRSFNSNNMGG